MKVLRLVPPLVATLLIAAVPAAGRPPSRAQIAAAVRRAERSPHLWATVNICNRRTGVMGVRGQMPALGFSAQLRMDFEVDYWASPHGGFKRLSGLDEPVRIGTATRGWYQGGVRLGFQRHSGRLRGRVLFTWRRGGRIIGRATRLTRAGHSDADFGSPRGFSAATCVIP